MKAKTYSKDNFEFDPTLLYLASSSVFKDSEQKDLTERVLPFWNWNFAFPDKNSSSVKYELGTESFSDLTRVSVVQPQEEDLLLELINKDFDIQISPVREYSVVVKLISIDRAKLKRFNT